MANYLVEDTQLTGIANAIRSKGGTSAQLEFPDDFVEAIGDIPSGTDVSDTTAVAGDVRSGSYFYTAAGVRTQGTIQDQAAQTITPGTTDQTIASGKYLAGTQTILGDADLVAGNIKKDVQIFGVTGTYEGGTPTPTPATDTGVRFIDYDGTLIATKTIAEINAMSSDSDLPANPTHTGLIAQGWNWTVTQLKAQLTAMPNQNVYVGQMYITESGDTEIDIEMPEGRLDPILTICVKGEISVDWGDETTPDTVTGTSETTRKAVSHSYASAGSYTITVSVVSGSFRFYGSTSYTLLRKNTTGNHNKVYANCVKQIRIGNGITTIGGNAFQYCCSLANITIPNSVTSISSNAFQYCYSLTSITIPSGVTSIANYTFNYCNSLTSITIPSSVTSIGSSAFQYCYPLTSVTIPSSVASIGSNAFDCCDSLTSITIPSSVTSISSGVFQYCYSLVSIIIPSSVTSIASYAFANCVSLASIIIPSDVTSIGEGAFQNCYSLVDITIPSDVTSIGDKAFNGCHSLTSITIPSDVTSISGSAFQNCYSLVDITIPSSVTSIGSNAFQYCYSLASITIPSGVTSIGNNAFNGCNSLTSIAIPSGVTSIGNTAFQYCFSLASIIIPSDVTSIGEGAFNGCPSLASIIIPSGVTSIGNNAFSGCYGISEYHILPVTVPTGGTTMFNNIPSDCIIYVPYSSDHSILAAYQSATNWANYASYMREEPT